MGQTSIEWANFSFNPVIGCSKISPACAHCYAEHETPVRVARANGVELWGPQGARQVTSDANWRQPVRWNEQARRTGERARVFCASLSDWLEDRPEWVEPRARLLDLIDRTPYLDWLLLSKRVDGWAARMREVAESPYQGRGAVVAAKWLAGEAPANAWLGTTVENQEMADRRIPELLKISAAVRFLSCEPLLSSIKLIKYLSRPMYFCRLCEREKLRPECGKCGTFDNTPSNAIKRIDWVIAGGESGPKARPCHPDWARSLRDQCQAAGVPFFWKQWGEWKPISEMPESEHNALYRSNWIARDSEDQGVLDEVYGRTCKVETSAIGYGSALGFDKRAIRWIWRRVRSAIGYGSALGFDKAFYVVDGHSGMQVFKVGKKVAGRLLDGREWSQLPKVAGRGNGNQKEQAR